MTRSEAKRARSQRIHDAIARLAALYPDCGALLAETDPATLLGRACDEIEHSRAIGYPDKAGQ